MIRACTGVALAALASAVNGGMAGAQAVRPGQAMDTRQGQGPMAYALEVAAAKPPTLPLQYQLLAPRSELTAGDAAAAYLELKEPLRALGEELAAVEEVETDRLPQSVAPALLRRAAPVLEKLHAAARTDHARWPRATAGAHQQLDHLTPLRTGARLLMLEARLAIAERRYDDAVRSLQSGFALGQHLQRGGPLIQGLVATGISVLQLRGVQELAARPDGPNLYWALSSLPRPLVDARVVMEGERAWLLQSIPALATKRADVTPETWQQISIAMQQGIRPVDRDADAGKVATAQQMAAGASVVALAVPARKWLADRGMSKEDLAKLQPPQMVAMYVIESYEHVWQQTMKHASLPEHVARAAAAEDEELKATEQLLRSQAWQNPLLMTMPSISAARQTFVRLDREVVALQTVEAVRAYAAAHGKLPATLDELGAWPALVDPLTGRPLEYRAEGRAFTLTATSPDADRPQRGFVYEVRLRP